MPPAVPTPPDLVAGLPAGRPPLPEPLPEPVIDSHCHLDLARDVGRSAQPDLDVAVALRAAAAVGVTRVVQVGCDLVGARWAVQAAHAHPQLVAAVALHPNEAPRLAARGRLDAALDEIGRLAADPAVVAVGETGLDHFRTGPDGHAVQEESLRAHVALAARLGKALVIHDRDAHADVLRVLDGEKLPPTVVMHCFSGDEAFARACVERGYYLSFAGPVTFRNNSALRRAAAVSPLDRLLVETDAPYLAPHPHRGRPNASYLLPWTVRALAEAVGESVPVVCRAAHANAERAFGIGGAAPAAPPTRPPAGG
jgi:TatD DNase family protein